MDDPCFEWILRWGARGNGPDILADHFCRTIDELATIFPDHSQWIWGDTIELMESEGDVGRYPLTTVRRDMPKAIERNALVIEGYDTALPKNGFMIVAGTNSDDLTRGLEIAGGVGSTNPLDDFANDILLRAGDDVAPAYASFRDTTILLGETWEATYGVLCPAGLKADRGIGLPMVGWMAYLSPRAARIIQRPLDVFIEERPNGGLFMTATRDVFDLTNAAHVASARRIERVLDAFNDPGVDRSISYV